MSTNLTTPEAGESIAALKFETQAICQKVFGQAFGATAVHITTMEDAGTPSDDCIWVGYNFTPTAGCIWLGLDRNAATALGHQILAAKRRPSQHDHHALHAVRHLLSQVTAEMAAVLAARAGGEIGSMEILETEEPVPTASSFALAIESGETTAQMFIRPSEELASAFLDAPASQLPALQQSVKARNLDVLLDVEMPVSISFGSTRMPLKDIAKLTSGSTIDLERGLSEPIQVLVNNCSIARGEVVVVDGKFAVRIKDIISRQERLRSLT